MMCLQWRRRRIISISGVPRQTGRLQRHVAHAEFEENVLERVQGVLCHQLVGGGLRQQPSLAHQPDHICLAGLLNVVRRDDDGDALLPGQRHQVVPNAKQLR